MKLTTKILNLSLAIVCAILYSFFLHSLDTNKFLTMALGVIGLFSFSMFLVAFVSLSEIIKKTNIKCNFCMFIMAISALVFITSFSIGVTYVEANKNIILIITCISFASFLIFGLLSLLFEKSIMQNKNEK